MERAVPTKPEIVFRPIVRCLEHQASEVRAEILKTLGSSLETVSTQHSSRPDVFKIRDAQGTLLPLSAQTLTTTSSTTLRQPLILEVGTSGQVEGRGISLSLPRDFDKTVRAFIARMEERLANVEAGILTYPERRDEQLATELQRIEDTLAFMTQRLEQRTPPE
ncbi:uncharacterized protein LOC143019732 isoform X2 [Oratosquilla oratoria]|uniref:uncharacterized protein LOC143019732 isoform X2 n=1 Tax=Oratosquilla oratoria TaxID=337810 RepID=UPI003F767E8F